jgi:hypothetical protein
MMKKNQNKYNLGDQIKGDKIGRSYSTNGTGVKFTPGFGRGNRHEKNTREK